MGPANGVTWDAANGRFVFAPWRQGATTFVGWRPGEAEVHEVAASPDGGRFDGLEFVGGAGILAASQADRSLHLVEPGTRNGRPVVMTVGNPADIGVDTRRFRVAVPYIALNRVDVWQLPRGEGRGAGRSRRSGRSGHSGPGAPGAPGASWAPAAPVVPRRAADGRRRPRHEGPAADLGGAGVGRGRDPGRAPRRVDAPRGLDRRRRLWGRGRGGAGGGGARRTAGASGLPGVRGRPRVLEAGARRSGGCIPGRPGSGGSLHRR
jgi:hypothetical protein